jgi:hypothetical protein
LGVCPPFFSGCSFVTVLAKQHQQEFTAINPYGTSLTFKIVCLQHGKATFIDQQQQKRIFVSLNVLLMIFKQTKTI